MPIKVFGVQKKLKGAPENKKKLSKVWSTAQSEDIKMRGYVEVRSTMPVKVDGDNLEGSWPAIWMLGTGNGQDWPTHGEIDIVEAVNGDPEVTLAALAPNSGLFLK